jgi:hypothetical protein
MSLIRRGAIPRNFSVENEANPLLLRVEYDLLENC